MSTCYHSLIRATTNFVNDKLFSHRLRNFRDANGYSQDDTGKLLGVTGRYIGMIERGEKDVEPHGALAKLFALLETHKVHPSEFEPKSQAEASREHFQESTSVYRNAPPRMPPNLGPSDIIAQIRTDLGVLESGTHAEKRRAILFLRDLHLPALAAALKVDT